MGRAVEEEHKLLININLGNILNNNNNKNKDTTKVYNNYLRYR